MVQSKGASPKPADASLATGYSLLVEYAARGADRAIDVPDRPIPPTLGVAVVLFAGDVCARLAQILQRLVDSAGMVRTLIDRRMIVQILAIVVCGLLEIADGGIDLTYRFNLVGGLRPVARTVLDEPACGRVRSDSACR